MSTQAAAPPVGGATVGTRTHRRRTGTQTFTHDPRDRARSGRHRRWNAGGGGSMKAIADSLGLSMHCLPLRRRQGRRRRTPRRRGIRPSGPGTTGPGPARRDRASRMGAVAAVLRAASVDHRDPPCPARRWGPTHRVVSRGRRTRLRRRRVVRSGEAQRVPLVDGFVRHHVRQQMGLLGQPTGAATDASGAAPTTMQRRCLHSSTQSDSRRSPCGLADARRRRRLFH